MPPRPVVLDTNFLLVPFRFRIDILRELDYLIDYSHRYVVCSRTMDELRRLWGRVGKDGMAARLAQKLVEANRAAIDIVEGGGHVDDWIVSYARENSAIVCTNDSALRRRLRALDIKVITLKSKSKLGYV